MGVQTHRTIFVFDTPFLDVANFAAAEEAFRRFCQTIPEGVRIAVDFSRVGFISDLWPVLPMGCSQPPVQGRCIVCIGLNKNSREVLDCLGALEVPGYEYVDKGTCPNCGQRFKLFRTTCPDCGHFEVVTFTWRPNA